MAEDHDVFKREFKRYKKLSPREALDTVSQTTKKLLMKMSLHSGLAVDSSRIPPTTAAPSLGLTSPDQWNVYNVTQIPGLIFISDPFLRGHQHYWVKQCLASYPCKPNVCNLDAHLTRPGLLGQLWPTEKADVRLHHDLQYKLRWVTLGYHHNWDTKHYDSHHHSPFPPDLAKLTRFILAAVGFPEFTAEAAIVNYYHLDSTLSGHTDHSEKDLTAPLISISFGQSAIFLIGGQTKQDRPIPLLLNSGDIVVMSGESRLAYHALPKVLPPPDGHVSDVLSRAALEHAIEMCARDSTSSCCTVCRQLRAEIHSDPQDTCILEPSLDMHNSAGSSSHTKLPCCCIGCQWLSRTWPQFESYLSCSRINVNVRQVGNLLVE